jgi:transcriptional regulator with XRE-family HTH domain
MVRERRGSRKLREVAKEIGISPATLMRVENARIPDVTTFGKICHWLEVDPGSFLGFERKDEAEKVMPAGEREPVMVSAHLKLDQTPQQQTVHAVATMLLWAMKKQPAQAEIEENGGI